MVNTSPLGLIMQSILDNCGFSNIWESQGNFNSAWLNITLKQRLFNQFQQEWRSNMENSSKQLCYKLLKDNFEFEPYLDISIKTEPYLDISIKTEPYLDISIKTESYFVNLELVIIDYLSKQEDGMVLIMGIDCVIYARMQRQVMNFTTFFNVNLWQMKENYTRVNILHAESIL